MRFSPSFDNTAPASVTPGRGAAFDNSWWPQLRYQSAAFFESSNRPTWSPANATASTVNGWVMPGGSPNAFCDSSASGSFAGIANSNAATLFSVAITPQTVYPLLLATCGGFSFYAANAGASFDAYYQRVTVAGSLSITGPNGYTSTGHFRYSVTLDPEDESNPFPRPYDFVELQVYAQEAGLTARQSNTAPTQTFNIKTQLRNGNAFTNSFPETKFTSRFRLFSESVPVFYPAGTDYLTNKGYTFAAGSGTGSVQLRSGVFSTILTSGQSGTWFPIILTGEQSRPSLICTIGSYSFYATNAGGLIQGGAVTGSLLLTGPNGFSAIGTFNFELRTTTYGEAFQGYNELWFYLNETNRFQAQPTNTAPEARQ